MPTLSSHAFWPADISAILPRRDCVNWAGTRSGGGDYLREDIQCLSTSARCFSRLDLVARHQSSLSAIFLTVPFKLSTQLVHLKKPFFENLLWYIKHISLGVATFWLYYSKCIIPHAGTHEISFVQHLYPICVVRFARWSILYLAASHQLSTRSDALSESARFDGMALSATYYGGQDVYNSSMPSQDGPIWTTSHFANSSLKIMSRSTNFGRQLVNASWSIPHH